MRYVHILAVTLITVLIFQGCFAASETPQTPGIGREIRIDKQYMNLPVKNNSPKRYIDILDDGKIVREFEIKLAAASEKPDYWVFLDVSEFKNKTLTVRLINSNADSNILSSLTIDDQIKGGEGMYREKLRPQFHFTSRRGWVNDTNGMVYYEGEYHMFYQHTPYDWDSGDKTWGHAVSSDMVGWQELPDAIHPDALGAIWSGSAVIDQNNTAGFQTGSEKTIVCFYTSAGGTTPMSQGKRFSQSIAYSNDRGRTWTKYQHNPIMNHISGDNRDPRVFWHQASNQWVMVLFWEDHMMGFFTSPDLKSWTKRSELKSFHECPDMFELSVDGNSSNKKWILYGASGDYLIGQFDGKQFVPQLGPIQFQYGNCFYASQTFNNIPPSDGRRVQMAWGQAAMPDMPFNQMILFPVTLSLHTTPEGLRLYIQPAKEIETLHQQHKQWRNVTVKPGENPLNEMKGELFHMKADLAPQGAQTCSVVIRDIPIVYDVQKQQLTCEGKSAPLKPMDGKIQLEILVDRMSIEIYANGGLVYMPIGVNLTNNSETLKFISQGGNTLVEIMDVYQLKSIWFEGKNL
jgi:fructan beta-fructosidase